MNARYNAVHAKINNKTLCNSNLIFKNYSNSLNKISCKRCKKNLERYKILSTNRYLSNEELASLLGITSSGVRYLKSSYDIFSPKPLVKNLKKEIWKIYRTNEITLVVSNYGRFKNLKTGNLLNLKYIRKHKKRLYIKTTVCLEASGVIYKTFIDPNITTLPYFLDGDHTNLKVFNLCLKKSKKQFHGNFINYIQKIKPLITQWLETFPKGVMVRRSRFAVAANIKEYKLRNIAIAIKKFLKLSSSSKISFYDLCVKFLGKNDFPPQHMKL